MVIISSQTRLSSKKQIALERILKANDDVSRAYNFAQAFLRIVRQRLSKALVPWLEAIITHRLSGLQRYFTFYNYERPHQCLDYRVPAEVYRAHHSIL